MSTTTIPAAAAAAAHKSPSFLHRMFHRHAKDTHTDTTTLHTTTLPPQQANPDLESFTELMDKASTLPPAEFKLFLQEFKTEAEAQDRRREWIGNGRGILAHEGQDASSTGAGEARASTDWPYGFGQVA